MAYNFPYLQDTSFLKQLDKTKIKEQIVKIVVLSFDEHPIQEIQGKITSGTISLDGSSPMRRTCNLTFIADENNSNILNTKNLLSINKKVQVLVGFINNTKQYLDYPILWFPQGVFVIITAGVSHSGEGVNISLTLHDKMALLNGECGGTLPASVVFHELEDIDEDGNTYIKQPTIYQIIQQLVNHFGGEQLGKIIINDIDNRIKRVMKWTGNYPIQIYKSQQGGETSASWKIKTDDFSTTTEETVTVGNTFEYGQDVGYILTDFVYPGQLIGNAGETVVTILDKIKNTLGNYEYFYDVHGNFVFQQIKNYLNTSYSTVVTKQPCNNNLKGLSIEDAMTGKNSISKDDYLVDYTSGKTVYTFGNGEIITSCSITPQYQQIKNDFVVWGKKKRIDGKEIPIRYHLALDKKPEIGNKHQNIFLFTDPDDKLLKAKKTIKVSSFYNGQNLITGEVGQYYFLSKEEKKTIGGIEITFPKGIYVWSSEKKTYQKTKYIIREKTRPTNDYRTELYYQGVDNQPLALESNYYFTELKNQWPKLFDLKNNKFYEKDVNDIDFFLDIIDTDSAISEFNVENIGRRTATIVDDSINCIFEPEIPNLVFIETDTDTTSSIRNQCIQKGLDYIQLPSYLYNLFLPGGKFRSAYEEIRKELYQYTSYNEQISLTTLPIYYLEPNSRITINDEQCGVSGDYMIKTISLPLDINGTMSLSCTKAVERI